MLVRSQAERSLQGRGGERRGKLVPEDGKDKSAQFSSPWRPRPAQPPPHPARTNPSPSLPTSVTSGLFQAAVDEPLVCDPFPTGINEGD